MAEKFVLYRLLKFGAGHVTPPGIVGGGSIWEKGEKIEDSVFFGRMKIADGARALPEGVLETIDESFIEARKAGRAAEALKNYKKRMFVKYADPKFAQALREKMEGDDTKWKQYIELCGKIKGLTAIPAQENFI